MGCGYTVGNNFSRDIQTVSVPIFENATNRRGLEFQITEAVQKEITKRTPYRLTKGSNADTRLTGSIVSFRKDALGETRYDDPRELQISLMVKVNMGRFAFWPSFSSAGNPPLTGSHSDDIAGRILTGSRPVPGDGARTTRTGRWPVRS